MATMIFSIKGEKLAAFKALKVRAPKMELWRLIEQDNASQISVTLYAGGARHEECQPRWMIESVIAHDCTSGVPADQIAEVRVFNEDLFIAMLETDIITAEQLNGATVEDDGKTVIIEKVSFGGFDDGVKRNLKVVVAIDYGDDQSEEETRRPHAQTCFADGTPIP
jgi:hypothetical protein